MEHALPILKSWMMKPIRVLALTYMISPLRGSEYSVAWNYVETMRAHCDLTIIYGCAGPHMGDVTDFPQTDFIQHDDSGAVDFQFVPPPFLARWLNALNRRGILVYSFYIAFWIWQRAALRKARKLVSEKHFDVVHLVGPIGYREPGYLWKLPLPYVWGPIGGATSFPFGFVRALPRKGRLMLVARTIANQLQLRFGRRVEKALRRADFLFTATTENQTIFERHKRVKSTYLVENGIRGEISLNPGKFPTDVIRVVWIGSLEARKGLSLLIGAISRLRNAQSFHFDIIGGGPLRPELEQIARNYGIEDQICWHGAVPREKVMDLINQAHLHVVTGLNEGNPTSIWEALSRSVPVMTLDHCGMHDVVQAEYGVRIPVTDVDATVQAMADALQELADFPERLETMARACITECDRFKVVHRPAIFLDAYQKAIENFARRNIAK